MNALARALKHLTTGHLALSRRFPRRTLEAIEAAVHDCEQQHPGEIRFAAEAALHLPALIRGTTPRARAIEVFSQLRVWDTEHNNGVLIYLLLADHAVEIVADRGVAGGRVPQAEWDGVCALMRERFRAGDFEGGSIKGIKAVADVLARYPAGSRGERNELPDAPVLLS
jgi:uncharacterized membrane protein